MDELESVDTVNMNIDDQIARETHGTIIRRTDLPCSYMVISRMGQKHHISVIKGRSYKILIKYKIYNFF